MLLKVFYPTSFFTPLGGAGKSNTHLQMIFLYSVYSFTEVSHIYFMKTVD